MTSTEFIARRRADWERLAELCVRARAIKKNALARTGEEVSELARLYRLAVADLGRLRTLAQKEGPGRDAVEATVDWLNALVARAHAEVYVARPWSLFRLADFFTRDFPRSVRESQAQILFCAALFILATLVTYALCAGDLALARTLGGPLLEQNAKGFGSVGEGRDSAAEVVMASFYISNNVRVAFMCFALGVSAGLGTLYVLVQNGLVMGVTLAFVHRAGTTQNLLAFVASHGPIELGAIFVAAAAGLRMGHAIVVPGPWSRAYALRRAAASAVTLVMGAACMLLVAAFFEGFVSPSSLAVSTKCLMGGVNAAALIAYFALAGRGLDVRPKAG